MQKLKNEELNRLSLEEFKKAEKTPLIVVLDNVRSLHNVGSVFRTADAFLVEKIFLCGITGTPPNKEIYKTALGATDSLDWQYHKSTYDCVLELKQQGYKIAAVEQATGSILLNEFKWDSTKLVLIFGNEVNGVNEEVMKLIDYCIEIPQFGSKHSFNISISAGIVLWELVK